MAPTSKSPSKKSKKLGSKTMEFDSNGMFAGMIVYLLDSGVQSRRLQIWKQRLEQMGAEIEEHLSKRLTHIFAMSWDVLKQKIDSDRLASFKGTILVYQWLEDSLRLGEKVSENFYLLKAEEPVDHAKVPHEPPKEVSRNTNGSCLDIEEARVLKKLKPSSPQNFRNSTMSTHEGSKASSVEASMGATTNDELNEALTTSGVHDGLSKTLSLPVTICELADGPDKNVSTVTSYSPPDLNKNITDIFKKLIDIYRALGDDRRSFSYHKAIPVIENLPFKIERSDQVKNLPTIGKSLQDHIQEILTTGKLSKLEHFEKDEKVKTIVLFGDVWGIGPATALKLYDKGYRTLEDLKNEPSLTKAQRLGLQYFDDIKTRIPRHEVEEMEKLLRKIGQELLPEVEIVCGGSYRRGKSSCGDIDIIITHPDGQSHKGFLARFVKRLKEINFLREDLMVSSHIDEGTDSGVDTYFGLCTYPGQELRRRIDLKVYPREIYPFGLIAWTGNDVLNRRLRILAGSKGYRLDDTGLFPAVQGARASASLRFNTEREVFDFLGFPWLEPHERNL